jgi:hypothetical protein
LKRWGGFLQKTQDPNSVCESTLKVHLHRRFQLAISVGDFSWRFQLAISVGDFSWRFQLAISVGDAIFKIENTATSINCFDACVKNYFKVHSHTQCGYSE